mgnify:FL=1
MQRFIPIVTAGLAILVFGCRDKQPPQYYYPADLKTRSLPAWSPTNELPFAPGEAVSVALKYVSRDSDDSTWKCESIELSPIEWTDPITWEYTIRLSRESPRSLEIVRVLLDGKIWEPELNKRQ